MQYPLCHSPTPPTSRISCADRPVRLSRSDPARSTMVSLAVSSLQGRDGGVDIEVRQGPHICCLQPDNRSTGLSLSLFGRTARKAHTPRLHASTMALDRRPLCPPTAQRVCIAGVRAGCTVRRLLLPATAFPRPAVIHDRSRGHGARGGLSAAKLGHGCIGGDVGGEHLLAPRQVDNKAAVRPRRVRVLAERKATPRHTISRKRMSIGEESEAKSTI